MKSVLLGSATSVLALGIAFAQTPATSGATSGSTARPAPSMAAPAGTMSPSSSGMAAAPSGKAAASGDSNQAIATTSATADQPAKGSNSFTQGQAASRIEAKGYSNVTGLTKDQDGIWRGKAQKNGQSTGVWLDYKGNVGQQS